MSQPLLEVRDLTKDFSGTKVLKGINLGFERGEVHGLLGENGAGKSTLIKILTGVYGASGGEILLDGTPVHIRNPLDAHRLGLGAVYQDAELIGSFTVAQNVVLGGEPGRFTLNRKAIRDQGAKILKEIGLTLDPDRIASSLSAAEAQLVILATLFQRKYKLIVLDEPTARLSATEAELLFRLIRRFQEEGITIIYISHRLGEIRQLCDRITILRGGRVSATLALIYPPGIGIVLPGERWDARAKPMLDYFLAFQDAFNNFPGFNYEVQGVYQEREDGRIRFYTYAVRE